MLGVGPQELVILGALLLFLIIFGSSKFSGRTARDLGQLSVAPSVPWRM